MLPFENQHTEYKQHYVPEIRKEVVAFANSKGGKIYIGICDDGTIAGVENPDQLMVQVANALKDAIAPDVMPFVHINALSIEEKIVIELEIFTGTNKPYYIREKGLKPSGVYVRKGSSSQPVSTEGIVEMMIQNRHINYEECRSMVQDLTFQSLQKELDKRDIEFGQPQMVSLKLLGEDGLYTNLAYLLSDQCEVTTKLAIFQGTDRAVFRDREEFTGSIVKQLEEVYRFVDLQNKTMASFPGLDRIDIRDYPVEAVREAILNACVHRDYSVSGSTIINIYDDRMEIVSLGGLLPGMSIESIFLGASRPRNKYLANLFYRMRLIESYGTGIDKIQRVYKNSGMQPLFQTAEGVFKVTLPNCNYKEPAFQAEQPAKIKKPVFLNKDKDKIREYVAEHGQITRKEVEKLLQVGSTKAFRLLKELCEAEVLSVEGTGKMCKYVLR